jgi:hypothetical protein
LGKVGDTNVSYVAAFNADPLMVLCVFAVGWKIHFVVIMCGEKVWMFMLQKKPGKCTISENWLAKNFGEKLHMDERTGFEWK